MRFYANETLKTELLKKLITTNNEYIAKCRNVKRLYIIALIWFVVIFAISMIMNTAILAGLAVIIPIVLIAIGSQMKKNAKNDAGFPYSKRRNEFIEFFEDAVEFGYQDPDNKFSENMCVYTIFKENLTSVSVNKDLLTITGAGQFVTYDDFPAKRINHNKSQRKFYSDTQFTILLDYREREEIIRLSKEMGEY